MASPKPISRSQRTTLGGGSSPHLPRSNTRDNEGFYPELSPNVARHPTTDFPITPRSTTLPPTSGSKSSHSSPQLQHANSHPAPAAGFLTTNPSPSLNRKGSPEVTVVDLNYKKLQELPRNLFKCKNSLEKLSLAYNLLSGLPKTALEFQNLTNINLRSNAFSEFPRVLCHLPSLIILDISRNRIRHFPKEPGTLLNLKMLNISRNHLVLLPSYFGRMQNLEIFKFEGNPFVSGHELLSKEPVSNKKEWLEKLLHHLRELEDSGRDGIAHQSSRSTTRSTLTTSPNQQVRRPSSGKNTTGASSHRQSSITREAPHSAPRPSAHKDSPERIYETSDEELHDRKNSTSPLMILSELESFLPSSSPQSSRKSSILEKSIQPNFESRTRNSSFSSSHEIGYYHVVQLCQEYFFNYEAVNDPINLSLEPFKQILYSAYFIINRFQPWINILDKHSHSHSQLCEATKELLQTLSSGESNQQLCTKISRGLLSSLVMFTKEFQSKLLVCTASTLITPLRSLGFVLQEATWHLSEACSVLTSTFTIPSKSTNSNGLNLLPSISDHSLMDACLTYLDSSSKSPGLSRKPSFSSNSSHVDVDSSPNEKKLSPRASPHVLLSVASASLDDISKAKHNPLHLTAHMATSSAFKVIQLLGDLLSEKLVDLTVPWATHLQMADDSTHLLVSSLNLVTAASTLNSPPIPLYQRYLQDIYSFVRDIIQLTKALQVSFGLYTEAGPLPPTILPYIQTLTHTTKQLTSLLKTHGTTLLPSSLPTPSLPHLPSSSSQLTSSF